MQEVIEKQHMGETSLTLDGLITVAHMVSMHRQL